MRTLSLLLKPVSASCNLRCKYCFYADVADNRQTKNFGIMSEDVLEIVIRNALKEAEELCVFGFQGGEPTLAGLAFFRRFIELEKKYNTRHIKIMHTIQTNGMTMDDEWAEFLAKNNFLTGLSIDAFRQAHDEVRIDCKGRGTHDRSLQAARLLEKHHVEFNILSVVTKSLASNADKVYGFYKQQNFRHIQLIPCIDELGKAHGSNTYSLDTQSYGEFLCRLFDMWYEDFVRGDHFSIRTFDNYIQMLAGEPPENCAMAGCCNSYGIVEADGSVYPCDFYALDSFRLGGVHTHSFQEMLKGATAEAFERPSIQVHPKCKICAYYPICRGGCRRDRNSALSDTLDLNCYCEAYRAFFSHALPRMQRIAQFAMLTY